ncbi:alpha-glucosidase, family 31 of glycosyl hydrolase [Microbacterium testaceum StLB037]|uniref:Alpha-glucosidase, family 31 of glycosyl hydrolase n=1 Tax=Microbacterium testaceum (strain StLB037) TaxID=979556 RepID=E8N8D3_MICTS|nr:hypothetical protein [Microbacterium testaceum]BAJ74378.1 alpha-glucosidase, family 31 of glycosyl hydrolase [Microbacterium testaceum StLB037]
MALFNFSFVVSGDLSAAQEATRASLEAAGFTVEQERDHWKATHGNLVKTMFLGVRAPNDDLREVLDVKFSDLGGTVEVDLHRPIFQPAGGSDDGMEQLKLHNAYKSAIAEVEAGLQQRGVLVSAKV